MTRKKLFFNRFKDIILLALILFGISSLIPNSCSGQNIGGNGAGFYENIDEPTYQLLEAINQPFTIRVPGGAIAKFADPITTAKGWGLTIAGVDSIQTKYGSPDEEDQTGALQKWHDRTAAQPNYSYLDKMIEDQKRYPKSDFIWVANIFIPAGNTVKTIQYLIDNGVKISAIEMGNETYSQLNYDFALYQRKVNPIRDALKQSFPTIPISHICAPIGKGRKEQQNWNKSLKIYLSDGDLVTMHYYLSSEAGNEAKGKLAELPAMAPLTDRKKENYNAPSEALKTTFSGTAAQLLGYPHSALDSVKNLFAGHKIIITETNTQPSEPLGDTYLNAAYQFRFFNTFRLEFLYITWHNFVSPDVYGMVARLKKGETGPAMKPRTTFTSFDFAGNVPVGAPEISAQITINASGQHVYWFENTTGETFTPLLTLSGVVLDSARVNYFIAPYLSSNAIGVYTTNENVVNAGACGYITYFTSATPLPQTCYKKRIFFRSLGCKVDRDCKVNNCR